MPSCAEPASLEVADVKAVTKQTRKQCRIFRDTGQFRGSLGELVGCGERMISPFIRECEEFSSATRREVPGR
jgi:hypothetical protein